MTEKREFYLDGKVEESTVKPIITGIREINAYDDQQERSTVGFVRQPIVIIVNTYGGSAHDGLGLVGAMDDSETPIHTIVYGKAMSAGLLIFSAGHKRFATEMARLMYHQSIMNAGGSLEDIQHSLNEGRALMEFYDEYIVFNSKITQLKLDQVKESNKNWYFSGKTALELGLVDELLTRKIKRNKEVI